MQVKDVMSAKPQVLAAEATIREAANQMRELDAGIVPIYKENKLIGMVSDRDITVRAIAEGKSPDDRVSDILTDDVFYCFQDDEVKSALKNMHERQVQRFIVLNNPDSKDLVGIVSVADIADKCKDDESARAIAEACSHYH